jgi:mono/diheme cytochrome c family protein
MRHKILWLVLIMLLTACGSRTTAAESAVPPLPTLDTVQVERGRALYVQYCTDCHGARAEGAPGWPTPVADGLPPAPPHDDSGHTWHHPDRVLDGTIRVGMGDPLRPALPLRMPAFGDQISDADIRAVIVYFKSLWTEEHRRYQMKETEKDFAPTPTASSSR